MIKNKIILPVIIAAIAITFTSCNDWLDELPDQRTEIDSKQKVKDLLVSAYSWASATAIAEQMSDNVTDNGNLYTVYQLYQEEMYKYEIATGQGQDTPSFLWNYHYKAIATANNALEYILANEDVEDLAAQKGEALLCRAYHHFELVNIFSQHYNTITSATDLGIAYVTEPSTSVTTTYERLSVKEVYRLINEDLEIGLPLIDDSAYPENTVKYHFNKKAAYAFAARFNLFYENYDKTIEYATKAIGEDPSSVLRNHNAHNGFSSPDDFGNYYINTSRECNLLIIPKMSFWAIVHQAYGNRQRYAHNMNKLEEETIWAGGPWGNSSLKMSAQIYGGDWCIYYPKLNRYFEFVDVIAQTGRSYIISVPFTTDETLLCRAEAYIMKEKYTEAARDLFYWYKANTSYTKGQTIIPELDEATIVNFYSRTTNKKLTPELNPKFEIKSEVQKNFLHCVLHFRRLETLHDGSRWFDIKRFGIVVNHPIEDRPTIVLEADDVRRAVQIPTEVISAGVTPNPR